MVKGILFPGIASNQNICFYCCKPRGTNLDSGFVVADRDLSSENEIPEGRHYMKASTEKIKARGAQFQKEGVRVRATLELNAGMKETPTSQEKISKSLTLMTPRKSKET